MNISSYIKELIIKNECIILSDFGGFETHYQSSLVDRETGKLSPPSKQLVFREDLKKDNGVLIKFIQDKEGISIDDAKAALNDYISSLKNKLAVNNRAEIEGVGVLIKKMDGNIFLKPIETENYLIDSFGLSELNLPEQKEDEENIQQTDEEILPAKSGKAIYIITFLTLFITLLIILSVKTGFMEKISDITGFVLQDKKDEKVVFGRMKENTDTVNSRIEQELDDNTNIRNALRYTEPKPEIETKQPQPAPKQQINQTVEKKYLIVAGSFIKESYALRQTDKLKKIGYNSEIVRTKSGQYRVVLNSYEDKNFALQELGRYRASLGNNIWLWTDC